MSPAATPVNATPAASTAPGRASQMAAFAAAAKIVRPNNLPITVSLPWVSMRTVSRGSQKREAPVSGVLDGIKVLDFGRYIAGPFCAALLGDLGAEVIRIERIGGGEDRGLIPVGAGPEAGGAVFLAMNRNKLGMTLDPGSPKGREITRKLVATADVVVANLPPAVLRSLGLDLDSLRAVKPDIVLTTVTGFGAGGPLSHKHGFDGIGQSMSGA